MHLYWGIVKAYSGLFRHTEDHVQPLHIHNLAIFQALAYLEPEAYSKILWNVDQVYPDPYHSQNSLFKHYSAIFKLI